MRIAAGPGPEGESGGERAPSVRHDPSVQPSAHGGAPLRLDPDQFARRFQDAYRALWCIAAGVLGDRSRAADIVQDAALIALRKLDEFDAGTSFLAWMGRIVRFTAINDRRKFVRHRTSAVEPAAMEGLPDDHADRAASGAVLDGSGRMVPAPDAFDDRVLHALQSLGDQARACLLLRAVMDLPYREISLALDIPEGTAMSHVHRARAAMRTALARPEDGRPSPPPGQRGTEDRKGGAS